MSNRDKLAFTGGKENNGNGNGNQDDSEGLTKLEYFIGKALQGYCSNGSYTTEIGVKSLEAAQSALDAIDALSL